MSKTLTANFTTEKNKTANANILTHLLEIDASGGTVFYSDRSVNVSNQAYTPTVLNWGSIENQLDTNEDFIRVGEINIQLSNSPRIDDTIDTGDVVRFYVWYGNLVTSDKLKIFEGIVSDDIEWDAEIISFTAEDRSASFDKIIWNPLQSDSFDGTPEPDDLGKQMAIVYGDHKNHVPLIIDRGGITTLGANMDASSTAAITVRSTSVPVAFEISGNIYIGGEKISYTYKTETTFTGITRGAGSTRATAHTQGDGVFEDHGAKYLVANHITKTSGLTNVRLMPIGGNLGDAVNIDAAVTASTNDSGVATVTISAANVVTSRTLINVAVDQQPAALDDLADGHNHAPAVDINVDVLLDAQADVSTTGVEGVNWSHPNRTTLITDGNLNTGSTYTAILGALTQVVFNLQRTFAVERPGSPVRLRAKFKHDSSGCTRTWRWKLIINGVTKQTITVAAGTVGTVVSNWFGISAWTDINSANTVIRVELPNDGAGWMNAGDVIIFDEAWYNVDYAANNEDTKVSVATITSTEVLITGSSLAESLGILICDIEGYQDDNPAHYTDSANALIEEPWDVIHHLLENRGNSVTDSEIDLDGSFQNAEDNLPASYKFAFAINTRRSLSRLIALLARQTFCRMIFEAGQYKLVRIKTSGTSTKSLDTDNDSVLKNNRLQVSIRKRGLREIVNDVEVKYKLNPTLGGWDDAEAYEGTSVTTDATSITSYGTQQRTWLNFAIGDNSTMADDLAGKLKDLFKDPRREVSFPTFLKHIELERGDVVDLTTSQLGLSASDIEIINTRYIPFSGGVDPEMQITGLIL